MASPLGGRPARRGGLSRWGYLALYHLLPGIFFTLVAVTQVAGLQAYVAETPAAADLAAAANFWATVLHRVLLMLFLGLVALLFVLRRPARKRTTNPVAITVAFLGTFSLTGVASAPYTVENGLVIAVADVLLVFGNAAAILALLRLGRNLSITPAARGLVTDGAYGVVRHPLYAAEITSGLGSLLPAVSLWTVPLFLAFVGFQVWRTYYEEAILTEAFPQYADYRRRVPRLVPFWRPSAE